MLKAMVFKELRETLWIAGVALILFLYVVTDLTGFHAVPFFVFASRQSQALPFVHDGFVTSFAWVAVPFALALGFVQTAVESARGTWLFLLHRPVPRGQVLAVKLLVGGGLYLVCAGLPILIYAWWAATPGAHNGPFRWSMTLPAWQALLGIGGLYLGAFLAGVRPARWFGSRLFPLAAAGLLVPAIQFCPWWWILGLAATLALAAWLILDVLFVAQTREY